MLEYFVLDWRDFQLPVYPVLVLSHAAGSQRFEVPVTVRFPDRRVLEFDFPVINLTALDAKAHAILHNTAALALSLGKAVSDLARRGLQAAPPVMEMDGLIVFDPPKGARKITQRQVKESLSDFP